MYFLSINGTQLPIPSYYSVDNDDIDSTDSCRADETGIMHRRRIRKGVRTCDVRWILDGNSTAGLHVNLSEPVLNVTMLDPSTSGYVECEMYAKNIKSVFYQNQEKSELKSYWELSCKLIEY